MAKTGERQRTKEDLRVVKTREAVRGAFKRILETTAYSDITVSAVAREARISRKTFYAHYGSVDELLRQMICEMLNEVVRGIKPNEGIKSVEDWIGEFTRLTLETLRDNAHLNGNVVRCLPLASVLDMTRRPLIDVCSQELSRRGYGEIPGLECCLALYLGGLSAVYEDWSLSGRSAAALDEEAALIAHAISYGMVDLLERG